MTPEQQRQFIQEQRAAGVSDDVILSSMQQRSAPAPQRSGAGEFLPAAFSVGGAVLGGIAGALGGPPGAIVGGVAGATAGGAAGEAIQQRIETGFGIREKMNAGQIAAQGALSGGTQLIGGGVLKALGFAAKVSKPALVGMLSKISSFDNAVLEKTLQRSSGAIQGVSRGEAALKDVVIKTAENLSTFAKQTLKESKAAVDQFATRAAISGPGAKQALLQSSKNFVQQTVASLRQNYNIGVQNLETLVFDRAKNISNIVAGGDKSTIQDAFNSILTIPKSPTIQHIDSVLERLIVLRSKTPVGSPTGPETRAIIGDMAENLIGFVKNVPPAFGRGWAEYAKYIETSLPKRVMISDAKEIFGSGRLTPKEISVISKRVLQLYNTGNLAVREFAEDVGKKVGTEITETGAGTLMDTGGMVSVRAKELTTPSVVRQIVQYIPDAAIKNYVKTGNVLPTVAPVISTIAKGLGLTTKTLMQMIVNLQTDKTTR